MMAQDGHIVTKKGGPVAVSHTWNQFCYDPVRRVALWVNSMPRSVVYSINLDKENNVAAKGLGMPFSDFKKKLCKDGIYAWEFDPAKRKFTRREFIVNWKGPGNTTGGRQEDGFMRYIPGLQTVFFNGYLRNPKTGVWKRMDAKGGPGGFYGYDGDYDPKTRQFFAYRVPNMYAYSLQTKQWKRVNTEGPKHGRSAIQYDTRAHKFIVLAWKKRTTVTLWSFDPVKYKWQQVSDVKGDIPVHGSYHVRWYDPVRNVHVFYNSMNIWVYRYKKAGTAAR